MIRNRAKLYENHNTAHDEGSSSLGHRPAAQVALDEKLVGSVGRGRQEDPADESRPKGVAPGQPPCEVKERELRRRTRGRHHLRPASGNLTKKDRRREHGAPSDTLGAG